MTINSCTIAWFFYELTVQIFHSFGRIVEKQYEKMMVTIRARTTTRDFGKLTIFWNQYIFFHRLSYEKKKNKFRIYSLGQGFQTPCNFLSGENYDISVAETELSAVTRKFQKTQHPWKFHFKAHNFRATTLKRSETFYAKKKIILEKSR